MWSNVISVDKAYDREIDYILNKLQGTKDVSYAVEESKDRLSIYLASACERQDKVESEILAIVQEVYLTFLKTRFYKERLNLENFDHAKCAFLSSLVHFDREFESNIVSKVISCTLDYNIDGLYNFRLRAIKESWEEIAEVANRLLAGSAGDADIFDIASFITGSDGKKSQLLLKDGDVYNITKRQNIKTIDVFNDDEYDLLFAIVREKPVEILVENGNVSPKFMATLKHLTRVITK